MERWGQLYYMDVSASQGTSTTPANASEELRRLEGNVSKELRAIELVVGEKLFPMEWRQDKTPHHKNSCLDKNGWPKKERIKEIFANQLSEESIEEAVTPAAGSEEAEKADFSNIMRRSGRFLIKKARISAANDGARGMVKSLAQALWLLMAARQHRVRVLSSLKERLKNMEVVHEVDEEDRPRKLHPGKEEKRGLESNIQEKEKQLQALHSFVKDLIEALRELERQRPSVDSTVALAHQPLCPICMDEDLLKMTMMMVRTFCGHRFCLRCYVRYVVQKGTTTCFYRCKAFQAVEVGMHVAIDEVSNKWMPTVKSVSEADAVREWIIPLERRRDFNDFLFDIRRRVQGAGAENEDQGQLEVDIETWLGKSRELGDQGRVMQGILLTYRSWVHYRTDRDRAIADMNEAVQMLMRANDMPMPTGGDVVRRMLGQTQGTCGLLLLKRGLARDEECLADLDGAMALFEASRRTMDQIRNERGQGDAFGHMGVIHCIKAISAFRDPSCLIDRLDRARQAYENQLGYYGVNADGGRGNVLKHIELAVRLNLALLCYQLKDQQAVRRWLMTGGGGAVAENNIFESIIDLLVRDVAEDGGRAPQLEELVGETNQLLTDVNHLLSTVLGDINGIDVQQYVLFD